jgi:hypothetical protein
MKITAHSTATKRASGSPLGAIKAWKVRMLTITGATQRYVTVDQQKCTCDDLKREDHPQVMRDIKGAHELSSNAGRRGKGMKCRKPFSPITRKITPARYRAITEAVLITGSPFRSPPLHWRHVY